MTETTYEFIKKIIWTSIEHIFLKMCQKVDHWLDHSLWHNGIATNEDESHFGRSHFGSRTIFWHISDFLILVTSRDRLLTTTIPKSEELHGYRKRHWTLKTIATQTYQRWWFIENPQQDKYYHQKDVHSCLEIECEYHHF